MQPLLVDSLAQPRFLIAQANSGGTTKPNERLDIIEETGHGPSTVAIGRVIQKNSYEPDKKVSLVLVSLNSDSRALCFVGSLADYLRSVTVRIVALWMSSCRQL